MAYRPPHRQGNQRNQKTLQRQQQKPEQTNLDWLPSVSRSGGLDGDGDSLKDHKVQERYRTWIGEKLSDYEKSEGSPLPEKDTLAREDIVRRFRKLREGILASNRRDQFATEVYETSLVLASGYAITDQVTAIASQILPLATLESHDSLLGQSPMAKHDLPREFILFLILLHHVVLSTRSSVSLRWIIPAISHPIVSSNLSGRRLAWLKRLRISLTSCSYQTVWYMTTNQEIDDLLSDALSPEPAKSRELAAVSQEVLALQNHVRDQAWKVLRAAYREEGEKWLKNCLSLTPEAGDWLTQKQKLQEALLVSSKDTPRWKVFKPKTV